MTLRVTSVIMAYTNFDQLKWSIDNLEKYCLFMENKLKRFILKEFNQSSPILWKIMLEGEIYHLLTQLPLTVEEKNNLVMYSRSFCQCGTELEWFALNAYWFLAPTWLVSVLVLTFFRDWTLFGNYKSKQTFRIHQFILESLQDGYTRDSINRMNNDQANH